MPHLQTQAVSKLIDVGVDWMTLTTKDSSRAVEWREAFQAVASEEQQRGYQWKEAKFYGYTGEQCGRVLYGKRNDGALVRLSSSLAHDAGMLFEPDAAHCTRIDLQVTAELAGEHPLFLESAWKNAQLKGAMEGRPPKYTLIRDSEGGSTLYVGSRSSMRYGRIYDKGIELAASPAGKLYRWEMEIKDVLADQAVAMLCGSSSTQTTILGVVGDFFASRNLPISWRIPSHEEHFSIPKVRQEDAGSLRWLAGPVASVMARLMETVGPEAAFGALLGKWRQSSTDCDIVHELAMLCQE